MTGQGKATRIRLFDFESTPMRAFHMTWAAFFLAFFGWFGIAPLMVVVREDLGLSKTEIGDTIIASVAVTVVVRILIGPICDRIGPRRAYGWLLMLGALPVMGIGLAWNFESFLVFRLAIGAIGASFVLTQVHTSAMFAPNCVGTATATTAGWGNLGGGATQMVMPLVLIAMVSLGVQPWLGWRLAMLLPGLITFAMGLAYLRFTVDTPAGNLSETERRVALGARPVARGAFREALGDVRVWALFVVYGACFGVELTMYNVSAMYFYDRFELSLAGAGIVAGSFGLMSIFARTLGGFFSDRVARRAGLRGRALLLFGTLLFEGATLVVFARTGELGWAIAAMLVFALFTKMAQGATFGIVPFINRRGPGSVAGIVGAGGNAGAVLAGFLFRAENVLAQDAFLTLGVLVTLSSLAALGVRFSPEVERQERDRLGVALDDAQIAADSGS